MRFFLIKSFVINYVKNQCFVILENDFELRSKKRLYLKNIVDIKHVLLTLHHLKHTI